MNRKSKVLVAVATSGMAISMLATPAAVAESTASGDVLATTVVRHNDVAAWFNDVSTVRAPAAGTGVDRIPSQGICFKAGGDIASLENLPDRQAWSDMRMGPPDTRGMLSLIGQYRNRVRARKAMKRVKALLASCPSVVVAGSPATTIRQSHWSLGKIYGVKGVAIYTRVDNAAPAPDSIMYVAVRRVGRSLAFTRFTRMNVWASGPPATVPTTARNSVNALAAKVAKRYHARTY